MVRFQIKTFRSPSSVGRRWNTYCSAFSLVPNYSSRKWIWFPSGIYFTEIADKTQVDMPEWLKPKWKLPWHSNSNHGWWIVNIGYIISVSLVVMPNIRKVSHCISVTVNKHLFLAFNCKSNQALRLPSEHGGARWRLPPPREQDPYVYIKDLFCGWKKPTEQ